MLRLKAVRCRRGHRVVLDDANLIVDAGELVNVDGVQGAGKSTLLAIAAAALRADGGAVLVGGRDVAGLQLGSLPFVRRNLGYLPTQPPMVRGRTALWNVALVGAVRGEDPATARDQASRAMDDLGIAELADCRVDRLSAGAARLVALARALAGGPALLVIDDPFLALDRPGRDKVVAALAAARDAGAAVLTATADPDGLQRLARVGGVMATLEGGRITGVAPRMALVEPIAADGANATVGAQSDPPVSAKVLG